MKRTLIAIAAALALLLGALPGAALAAEDNAAGTFTATNLAPTVNSVVLYDSTGTTPTTSMNPQTEYNVKVAVTDYNTLKDLATVKVTIFYAVPTALNADANSGQKVVMVASATGFTAGHAVIIRDSLSSETNIIDTITGAGPYTLTMKNNLANSYTTANSVVIADVPASGNTQTAAILTCTVADTPTWGIDPTGGGTTWAQGTSVQPTLTASTGTFEFLFTPGKVATENATGYWYIYAKATDFSAATGSSHQDNLSMNWWGQLTISDATIAFGNIAPNTTDQQSTSPTTFSLTNIANGAYKIQLNSSTPWTCTSPVASINLKNSGAPVAGELALKADDDGTVTDAQQVTDGYVTYTGYDNVSGPTVEAGADIGTNAMWLSLGSGIRFGIYNGIIYYQILNN